MLWLSNLTKREWSSREKQLGNSIAFFNLLLLRKYHLYSLTYYNDYSTNKHLNSGHFHRYFSPYLNILASLLRPIQSSTTSFLAQQLFARSCVLRNSQFCRSWSDFHGNWKITPGLIHTSRSFSSKTKSHQITL